MKCAHALLPILLFFFLELLWIGLITIKESLWEYVKQVSVAENRSLASSFLIHRLILIEGASLRPSIF